MLREVFLQQGKAQSKWEENVATLVRICCSTNSIPMDQNMFTLLSVLEFSPTALDAEMETWMLTEIFLIVNNILPAV